MTRNFPGRSLLLSLPCATWPRISRSRIALGRCRRELRQAWRHRLNERALATADGVVTVRIHAPAAGLGAHLHRAVIVLNACRARGVMPCFRFTSPQYGRPGGGYDWLAQLYDQPYAASRFRRGRELLIDDWLDLNPSLRAGPKRGRRELAEMLNHHFRLAEPMRRAVEALAMDLLGDRPTLGVHYRGTDKRTEAPTVSHAEMFEAMRRELRADPEIERIFVATDSHAFREALADAFEGRDVRSAPDVQRSSDETGVHFLGHGDPVEKAREALVNALLLGRCRRLVKTDSALSHWTSLLHPGLPVTQVNAPYRPPAWAAWFPLA